MWILPLKLRRARRQLVRFYQTLPQSNPARPRQQVINIWGPSCSGNATRPLHRAVDGRARERRVRNVGTVDRRNAQDRALLCLLLYRSPLTIAPLHSHTF